MIFKYTLFISYLGENRTKLLHFSGGMLIFVAKQSNYYESTTHITGCSYGCDDLEGADSGERHGD
jgi:hypothetical protein